MNEKYLKDNRIPVSKVKKLTNKEYYVGGCTALLDALGNTIHSMEEKNTDRVCLAIKEGSKGEIND